jgi:hypothetical protein
MVVMWESLEAGPSRVEWGAGDEPDQAVESETPVTIHEILVEGLAPDTRYAYRVVTGGLTSAKHHFRTAPLPGAPVRLTMWADTQAGPLVTSQVVQAMSTFAPHLTLHAGDEINDGKLHELWQTGFFEPLRPLGHEVPFFVAIGNHENNALEFYDYQSYPHPLDDPAHESYYSFSYGNLFILMIDTNKAFFPMFGVEPKQFQWIRAEAFSPQAQAHTWRVAVAHEPGYSEGWDSFDGHPGMRDAVLPLLGQAGFHLFFAGHTHDYERGMKDGILQVIAGIGNTSLDPWVRDWEHVTVFDNTHTGYVQVSTTCEALTLDAVALDGTPIDHVVLRADQPGVIAEDGLPGGRTLRGSGLGEDLHRRH